MSEECFSFPVQIVPISLPQALFHGHKNLIYMLTYHLQTNTVHPADYTAQGIRAYNLTA